MELWHIVTKVSNKQVERNTSIELVSCTTIINLPVICHNNNSDDDDDDDDDDDNDDNNNSNSNSSLETT